METAMCGIRVNAHNRPFEPAFAPPGSGVEKNLHPVTDLDLVRHAELFAASRPENETEPNRDGDCPINRPLRITRHKTAGQDVDSLQEPDTSTEDEQYTDDTQYCFHGHLNIGFA
jgi:hypothetical protein